MGKNKCSHDLPESEWVLREMLKVAMEDEKNANVGYRRLAREANYYRDRKRLFAIADDEGRHFRLLSYIYKGLFGGPVPKVRVFPKRIHRFDVEVGKAIADEYDAAEFYKEILGKLQCEEYKNIIRSIIADELNHARILENMLGFCQGR